MPSHLHMICKADDGFNLSDILRGFKKYIAKAIIGQIINEPESRREWILALFSERARNLKRVKNYKFWQDGNQAKVIFTKEFFYEKLEYIHNNPVQDLIVENLKIICTVRQETMQAWIQW